MIRLSPFATPNALASFLRGREAAAAVEFAFVMPIVIALVLGTLQVALVWQAKTTLQTATQDAGRLVMTRQASEGAYSQAQFKQELCKRITALLSCEGVMVSLQKSASLGAAPTAPPKLTYDGNGAVSNKFPYDPGGSNSVMTLQTLYQLPVVGGPLFGWATQANGTLLIVGAYVFQNEP